ncbi:MAG: sigma-70 family RNA polymerase sigma factor [Pirellulaceae bacterium]|nr:sigma-70 family RNA polymerase sigma factor [Pirellulaceae bacterium]
MTHADFNPMEDPFTRKLVTRKAKQIARNAQFTLADAEDIEQDIFLRILQSWPSYQPEHSHRNRFITTVVERYAASLLRNRSADKRDDSETCSLSSLVEVADVGLVEMSATISDHELDARLGRKRRDESELTELRADIEQVVASLPLEWQRVLELRKTYKFSEISQITGISRTTIRTWLRQIRAKFEAMGIKEYL